MKKILHYLDRITGEYLITREVDTAFYGINIPNTIEGELLPFKDGFSRFFHSNKCEYIEDNRNKDIHNTGTKEDSICDYIGALKSGFALGKYIKTEAELLKEERARKTNEINLACRNEIIGGFKSSAKGDEYLYRSTELDQMNLIGQVATGVRQNVKGSSDNGLTWKRLDHLNSELKQLLKDGATIVDTLKEKAFQLKNQISTASLEQLDQIKW